MSSGLLALAWVSSWQVARTSNNDVGDVSDVAQPASAADNMSKTIQIISRIVLERRGSIVCSFRL
jgi:hypothetical protein